MRVVGLAGWSGSGKTTLVTSVIPVLVKRGLTVATVKHAHHAFEIDRPGKDSWLHREAGATEVAIVSSVRWAIVHELRGESEPPLTEILAKLSPADLVIVEGFKRLGPGVGSGGFADIERCVVHRGLLAGAGRAMAAQARLGVKALGDYTRWWAGWGSNPRPLD